MASRELPLAPGSDRFFDDVTGSMSSGTSLVSGAAIDTQILHDLFGYVAEARERLAPMKIGKAGDNALRAMENLVYAVRDHTLQPTRTNEREDRTRNPNDFRGLEGIIEIISA